MSDRPLPIVQLKHVRKQFGHHEVLRSVDVNFDQGRITALVGDNGAGKSTLIKIVCGVFSPDGGQVIFDGRPVRWHNPDEARRAGIETVYQDLALIDTLSVSRNFFLAKEPCRDGFPHLLDQRKMDDEALAAIRDLGIDLQDPSRPVGTLSGGQRKSIAIARSLYFKPKLLVLDEPTAALSIKESRIVNEHVQAVKEKGISVIYITHNLYPVFSIADRFVVLERGEVIVDVERTEVTPEMLIEAVVTGRRVAPADVARAQARPAESPDVY
ncbi:MAG: sugar ABC transporter ATP-binding protein [Planctomycetes bacterium]|nr:sugar ABC transporter ATP-binding protein [Planctomycetota bacterium]